MEQDRNARIFQEARSADQLRDEMKSSVLERMRDSTLGRMLGQLYDSPLAQSFLGAARDTYREVFERGWTGRYWLEGEAQRQTGQQPGQNLGQAQDLQRNFYGWEKEKEQSRGQEHDYGYGKSR